MKRRKASSGSTATVISATPSSSASRRSAANVHGFYKVWFADVRKRLAAAALEAEPLIEAGRFDEADLLMRRVNDDIYGAVALGDLYTKALERCVQSPQPDRARAQALYDRALRYRSAWPGVHTAEEAAAEQAHVEQVRHELTALLESGQ